MTCVLKQVVVRSHTCFFQPPKTKPHKSRMHFTVGQTAFSVQFITKPQGIDERNFGDRCGTPSSKPNETHETMASRLPPMPIYLVRTVTPGEPLFVKSPKICKKRLHGFFVYCPWWIQYKGKDRLTHGWLASFHGESNGTPPMPPPSRNEPY